MGVTGTEPADRTGLNSEEREREAAHAAGERLRSLLRDEFGSVCVGYSGGVDSVFLSVVALEELGPERVLAVTGRSDAYPEVQRRMALECVERFGIPHLEVATSELEDPSYAANPSNRCYFCKSELWDVLGGVAAKRGLARVVDGSNADDASDHRPGAKAAAERGVRSPLQEARLTKRQIRLLSQEMGLPTWDQPASPCLASRIAYGVRVTPERLGAIERAEESLRALGFRTLRVRVHGDDVARLELAPAELPAAVELAAEVRRALLEAGFARALLDVEGYRRGALNGSLPVLGEAAA